MAKKRTRGSGDEPNTERSTMVLSCKLTGSEVASYADQAANLALVRDQKEEARVQAQKDAKAAIDELDGSISAFLRKVRDKSETREVVVETVFGFSENAVRVVRLDSGEVVSERAMTYDERQEQLFPIAGGRRKGDGEAASSPA
jgi:hypothetical protein